MRLAAPLVGEVGGEVELLPLAGQPVELDQRDLDLLVPGVAALLTRASAEGGADVVEVALHHVEHLAAAGGLEVGDRAFEQVAAVVELVVVAEVGPAVAGLVGDVPEVEVAVGELGGGELVDDVVDLGLDGFVAAVVKGVGRRLDPLADVGIPEDLGGEAVRPARDAERARRVGRHQRLEQALGLELGVLAGDGAGEHRVEPLAPEGAGQGDAGEVDRGEASHQGVPSRVELSRTARVQGRRSVPWNSSPPIIRMIRRPAS